MTKANSLLGSNLIKTKGQAAPISESAVQKKVFRRHALTLKLDDRQYRALKAFAYAHDMKHQEILVKALEKFLASE